MTFTLLDIALIFFALASALLGFFRGFVKDFFSLLKVILATIISYLLSPITIKLISPYVSDSLMVQAVVGITIYIIAFVILLFSTKNLIESLSKGISRPIDQSLGVLFGLLKILLIFGFIYSATYNIYTFFNTSNFSFDTKVANKNVELPTWLTKAQFYKIVKFSGEIIDPITKKIIVDSIATVRPTALNTNTVDELIKKKEQSVDKKQQDLEPIKTIKEKQVNPEEGLEGGYSKKEIDKMNRLIEIIE